MKSITLAVFGHYDSRGGTTAMPLDEATPEAVRKVMLKYDREVFGIEEAGDEIATTAYGMEARVADKVVHELIHGDTRPSTEDFMYVAELHYPDDADLSGDLEEQDSDGRYRRVLKSGGENEERFDETGYWPDLKTTPTIYQYAHMPEPVTYHTPTLESLIEESCKKPVQLELAILPTDFRKLKQYRIEMLGLEMEVIRQRVGVKQETKTFYWDDAEYKKLNEQHNKLYERLVRERGRAICKAAKVISNPSTARWDDDAFGFIIGTGE